MAMVKHFSREARDKIAATHRSKKQSPEHIAKRVAAFKKTFKPKPWTEERKRHHSALLKGRPGVRPSDATRAKIAASLRGRKLSPEHVAHIREGMKDTARLEAWQAIFGEVVGRQPKSAAHRAKIGAALKGRVIGAEQRAAVSLHHRTNAEFRAKVAAAHEKRRGVPLTEEHIAKVKAALPRGERHYNWKGGGGATLAVRFSDPRYEPWRRAVIERCARTCQGCGRHCNRDGRGFHCHHVRPYAAHPALRYDPDNGLLYCRRCHVALHRADLKGMAAAADTNSRNTQGGESR